jgi:hypothetical protein
MWMYHIWAKVLCAWRATLRWHYRNRPPPYRHLPGCDPLGTTPGNHDLLYSSRHDIAECGLVCKNCRTLTAERGDFSKVVYTQHGEAVKCENCGLWLVASPDTEHGDDLIPYERINFHRFVRISKKKATREQYGDDISTEMTAAMKRFRLGTDAALHLDLIHPPESDPYQSTAILPAIKE